ncbi:CHAT domain-containing protein [Neolewinella xylanilytica]|uniref:CHAT domain-containing protein n=1 Tax=Neolewinella xylanilytica TaxID=1514080 RepID=A0A2S6I1E3_9BACT|nr:CHAT domain-containing protein [Neolewinella xylanilytica]PPK84701.1 CHAT domain-containing protein [Neolewinella xylanilytica]
MRYPLAVTIIGYCLLLLACGVEPERFPVTKRNSPALGAIRSLDSVGAAIDAFRLEEALRTARRIRPRVEARADSLPDTLRARLYQYLAELHTLHSAHFDSITFFTRSAEELIPTDAPVLLRARQLYVRSLGRTAYDRTWVDVMMTADHGLQLLEEHALTDRLLYGKLLIARGIGGKKHADDLPSAVDRQEQYGKSIEFVRRAVDVSAGINRAWQRYAWVELGFLAMRMDEPQAVIRQTVDTIGALDPTASSADSLYVLAYYHFYGDRPELAYTLATELADGGPHFNYGYTSGADYIRYQAALQMGNYDIAVRDSKASAGHFGCCPVDQLLGTKRPCPSPRGCANYMTGHANVRMQRYAAEHDARDLDTAFLLSQWALDQYELNFRNEQEESALNVLQVLGQRMLNTSLEAAYATAVRDPAPPRHDALFRTMERGKALLLELDLREGLADAANARIVRDLRERRTEMQELKDRYLREGRLPLTDLAGYQQVSGEYERLSASLAPEAGSLLTRYARSDDHYPTVDQVQSKLGDRRALLEFAESGSSILGLYVDADTVMSYRVDSRRVDSLARRYTAALRMSVVHSADTAGYYAVASDLHRTLLGPIAGAVRKREELLIAGSPLLQDLPLSALMDGPDRYLLDRLMIRYIPSWRVELQHEERRRQFAGGASPRLAVWTHPQLTHYFFGLNDYLGTRGRADFLPPSTDLAEAAGADIIHLSVHARGNSARLHDNYLYFSPSDSLNGIAIGQQPLGARLVVLAACSTARGYANPGEGTFSLQRSFHVAGVPDVVSSVYDIPAGATAAMLKVFYRELFAGKAVESALQTARVSMRSGENGARYTMPGYWAGLIIG